MKTHYQAKKINGALGELDRVIVRVSVPTFDPPDVGVLTIQAARYVQKDCEEQAARHEKLSDMASSAGQKAAHRTLAVEALECAHDLLLAIQAAEAL